MTATPKPQPAEIIEGFRCVESKDAAQRDILDETKGMSPEEEIAYFRRVASRGPRKSLWKKTWQERDPSRRRDAR